MMDVEKMEVLPLYTNMLIMPYEENPYIQKTTESGLKLSNGTFENPDSGNLDKKDYNISCARVIATGPQCKYIKEGDDVFYDRRSVRPVPFYDNGFFILAEQNVVCVINEGLSDRFENINK